MAGVVDLVDRAVALPPGPELSAVLGALPWRKVPNARLVEVVQARSRQLAHDQAELFAGMVEISHAVAVENLGGDQADTSGADVDRADAVERVEQQFEWASHEIAAGLTWTPTTADRELAFATALRERLPLVYESLQHGHIDRGKARVFVDYLDPANGELTEQQARRLCERFVPLAPGLTTKQLSDRLYRALHAIDPGLRRRRYERAVQARGVALYLDPRTGTATLVGNGLPPDEAAAAGERIDRLVEATTRAGHPATRAQLSADVYLGMLHGAFHGLTEAEIIDRLLSTRRPEDDPDTTGDDTTSDNAGQDTTADHAGAAESTGDTAATAHARPDSTIEPLGSSGRDSEPDDSPPPAADQNTARWAGDRIATREGIEIRVGLATAAGLDDRPAEIPGLGPVGAHLARTTIAGQQRGARWLYAIVDPSGHLLLAGPLRRRPHTGIAKPPAVRGGVVELHLTVDELQRYATDPALGTWHPVLAEIAAAWRDRDQLRRRLAANPQARFARGPLADHVRIRDRSCVGPGCTRSARRCDLDHTHDHSLGGETVDDNIGPACKRHHPDKDRNWTLTQPAPGLFRWVSPLGRTYFTRGEPIRPDLPDPDPADHPAEETAAEVDHRLRRHDPRILQRPAKGSPRPPPPRPESPPDDEPPPF
jgi:hypothetical protein